MKIRPNYDGFGRKLDHVRTEVLDVGNGISFLPDPVSMTFVDRHGRNWHADLATGLARREGEAIHWQLSWVREAMAPVREVTYTYPDGTRRKPATKVGESDVELPPLTSSFRIQTFGERVRNALDEIFLGTSGGHASAFAGQVTAAQRLAVARNVAMSPDAVLHLVSHEIQALV